MRISIQLEVPYAKSSIVLLRFCLYPLWHQKDVDIVWVNAEMTNGIFNQVDLWKVVAVKNYGGDAHIASIWKGSTSFGREF